MLPAPLAKKLLLFDIDGTLIRAAGAGSKALDRVFKAAYGIDNACKAVRLDGRTDRAIVREMVHFFGIQSPQATEQTIDDILQAYLANLQHEILDNQGYTILPGIENLLSYLRGQTQIVLGLATGNLKRGAEIKLNRGNLFHFFSCGGFGCDSEIRAELVAFGIKRGKAHAQFDFSPEQIFVIGDTEFDIEAGKKAGAKTVAVATGSHSIDVLAKYKPDFIFQDFSNLESFLQILS